MRHLGRVDPRDKHERAVLIADNAPWQAGQVVGEALADKPHLEFKRLSGNDSLDPQGVMAAAESVSVRGFGATPSSGADAGPWRGRVRSLIDGC